MKADKDENNTFKKLADVQHDIELLRGVLKNYDQSQ